MGGYSTGTDVNDIYSVAGAQVDSKGKAMAKLKDHLSFRGFIVLTKDEDGPIDVLVNGSSLTTWRRNSRVMTAAGKQSAKKDFWMELVDAREWEYEWKANDWKRK